MKTDNKLTAILIPAYKPTEALLPLVQRLLARSFAVIVVNDGSGAEFNGIFSALPPQVTLLEHKVNMGKGVALKTGIKYISEKMPEINAIVTADADGQHTPEDIEKVSESLGNEKKLVLGSRAFDGKVPFKSRFGNSCTRVAFALVGRVKIYDTQTGLRAFPTSLSSMMLAIPGERYEYEINMLLSFAKEKIQICEERIETVYIEDNASSHFNPLRDSLRIYSCILKFGLSSIASFCIDYSVFILLLYVLKLARTPSIIIARVISSVCNYSLNKGIVFKSKKSMKSSTIRYFLLVAVILGLNCLLMLLLNGVMGIPAWLAKIPVECVLFVLSYFVQKHLIF